MKIISSKIVAAMLVVLMLCMLLPSAALAVDLNESITKIKDGLSSYTVPAGTNAIGLKKDQTNVIWTEVALTKDEETAISSAFANFDSSWKTTKHYINGYGTFDLSQSVIGSNSPWGSWTVTKGEDGQITLASTGSVALSHIDYGTFTGLTNQPSDPVDPVDPVDPDSTPTPEKKSEPSMDKDISADGNEYKEYSLDNAVKPGDTVYFKLESNLPEALKNAIETAGTMKDEQTLTFTDTMTSNLNPDTNSVEVKIGTESVGSQYYTVSNVAESADGKTFTVTLDLTSMYNNNVIDEDDFGESMVVTVTYSATVSENVQNEEDFKNEAYATYNETPSVTSTVTGTVTPDPETPPTPGNTGGAGTTLFTVGGLGLMAVAGALLLRRRQDA